MKGYFKRMFALLLALIISISSLGSGAYAESMYFQDENQDKIYNLNENITEPVLNPEYIYYINHKDEFIYGYIPEKYINLREESSLKTRRRRSLDQLREAGFPQKYDSRERNIISPVKNQYMAGVCWAFSSLSTIETLLLKEGKGEFDFSEGHMAYNASKDVDLERGGNNLIAMRYFSRLAGPVQEKNAKEYEIVENNPRAGSRTFDNRTVNLMDEADKKLHEFYVPDMIELDCNVDNIKRCVMEYGSVASGYYDDGGFNDAYGYEKTNPKDKYHRVKTQDFGNLSERAIVNHQVTIVGWDDEMKIINKKNEEATGAFLVKNSWGKEKNGEKEDGFMWISYDSFTKGKRDPIFIFPRIEDAKDKSTQIYTYSDYKGNRTEIGNGTNANGAINIYKRQNKEPEKLTDVRFYNSSNTPVWYEIYLTEDSDNFKTQERTFNDQGGEVKKLIIKDNSNWKKIASGNLSNAGFYTIKINDDISLSRDKFALKFRSNAKSISCYDYQSEQDVSFLYNGSESELYYNIDKNFTLGALTKEIDMPAVQVSVLDKFEKVKENYKLEEIKPLKVEIKNIGNTDISKLNISLEGEDKAYFDIVEGEIADVNLIKGSSLELKIKPKEGLKAKSQVGEAYEAYLSISADNLKPVKSDSFKFQVEKDIEVNKEIVEFGDEDLKEFILDLLKNKNHPTRKGRGPLKPDIVLDNPNYEKDKDSEDLYDFEMKMFKKFTYRGKDLKNTKGLEKMTNLTELALQGNKIESLEFLKDFKNLVILKMNSNKIEDIAALKNLVGLKTLYINENKIKDFSPIKDLSFSQYKFSFGKQNIDIKLKENAFNLNLIDKEGRNYNLEEARLGSGLNEDYQTIIEKGDDGIYKFTQKPEDTVLNIGKAGDTGTPIWIINIDASSIPKHEDEKQNPNEGGDNEGEKPTPPSQRTRVDFEIDDTIKNRSVLKEALLKILKSGEKDFESKDGYGGEISATISKTYKKPQAENEIFEDEMALFTDLSITKNMYLVSLKGLEKAINLENLTLFENSIRDLSPIKALKNLKTINMDSNYIEDISALANLSSLQSISFISNEIKDMTSLQNLKNLKLINLGKNGIQDLSPLQKLEKLENLSLYDNKIEDISTLKNLPGIRYLRLENNNIKDVSALEGNKVFANFSFANNRICDFSPLKNTIRGYTYARATNDQRIELTPEKSPFTLVLKDCSGKSYELEADFIEKVAETTYKYKAQTKNTIRIKDDFYSKTKGKYAWIVTIDPVKLIQADKEAQDAAVQAIKALEAKNGDVTDKEIANAKALIDKVQDQTAKQSLTSRLDNVRQAKADREAAKALSDVKEAAINKINELDKLSAAEKTAYTNKVNSSKKVEEVKEALLDAQKDNAKKKLEDLTKLNEEEKAEALRAINEATNEESLDKAIKTAEASNVSLDELKAQAKDKLNNLNKLSKEEKAAITKKIDGATSKANVIDIITEAEKENNNKVPEETGRDQYPWVPPYNYNPFWSLQFYTPAKTESKPATETKAPAEIKMDSKLVIGSKKLVVTVNGVQKEVVMDVEPFISNNRTMLPIRFVAEALGFKVEWDDPTRTVILTDKDTVVKIPVDTNQIIVNGTVFKSDAEPILKSNRTMLPIANIARALGLVDGKDIIWDGTTKEVIIKRETSK